jgi:SAM-dependent methyltransferase
VSTDPAPRYDSDYYTRFDVSGRSSADVICPLLLRHGEARSVVDVGCGNGYFLDAFAALGVGDRLGVDGPFNDGSAVRAAGHAYTVTDLEASTLSVGRRFDLAICLEVAEHLEARHASRLVEGLVAAADVVAFSAAVPEQPGRGHVNCRWPSYWAGEFARHGYRASDVLRPVLRGDDRVSWWYQQNLILYTADPESETPARSLDLAHPTLVDRVRTKYSERRPGGREALGVLRDVALRRMRTALHR